MYRYQNTETQKCDTPQQQTKVISFQVTMCIFSWLSIPVNFISFYFLQIILNDYT